MSGGYRLLVMRAPEIVALVTPGQFVHVRIAGLGQLTLRRPFSVFKAEGELLSVLYKKIGQGTRQMAATPPGETVDLLGPLGKGFPVDGLEGVPVLVGGGYGVAPLYLLASHLKAPGVLFVGGASTEDLLCLDEFAALGWPTYVATEDGSSGMQGLVTAALDNWLAGPECPAVVTLFASGPDGMLRAIGERAIQRGATAWLSLDKHMGCGVGACLACVQRLRDQGGAEYWGRVCKDGPVFEARDIVWQ